MKVNRHQPLFYRRRRSNLYRISILMLLILVGTWFATRMLRGTIRSPFDPTPTPTRTGQSLILEGEASFGAGNLDKAIAAYQEAVQVDPNNAEVWAQLARIQAYSSRLLTTDAERLKRLEDAQNSIDQAVKIAPDDSDVHAIRAFVLDWHADPALVPDQAANMLIEAEQEATQSLHINSHNPLALAFYAEVLVDQQKWSMADQYIQQALQYGSNSMDVHRVYAYVLESTAQYNQAIEEYQKALAINPNLTFLYIAVGTNYRQLAFKSDIPSQSKQLYDQALEYFAKAARLNDQLQIQDPLPYIAIAKTYSQEGEFFIAAQNALKAIAFDQTNADLYGQLGIIYQKARNYESAIPALQCVVLGCNPDVSCQARFASACQGNEGVTVTGLPLSPSTVVYYYTYGSVLAALSPNHSDYCPTAVNVLNQVYAAFGADTTVAGIVSDGLNICAAVAAAHATTPTPAPTPTLLPTPKSIPTGVPYPTQTP